MAGRRNGDWNTELLTVGQVAAWINIHPNTVRRWAEQGVLNSYRIGSRGDRRFLRSEIEELLNGASIRGRSRGGRPPKLRRIQGGADRDPTPVPEPAVAMVAGLSD